MFLKIGIATVSVAVVFGAPSAILFAILAIPAVRLLGGLFRGRTASALLLGGPSTADHGDPVRPKLGAADKARFETYFNAMLRWTARADRLCDIPPGRRRASEASNVADVLQAACDRLLQMNIRFDDVGDDIAIRKSIAWAQSAITILRRELPQERPGRRAMEGALDIAYVDETGTRTERYVEARGIESRDGLLYLWAWCETKQAVGKFRVDRIAALADGESGEVVEPNRITRWLLERASGSLVPTNLREARLGAGRRAA